MKELNAIEKLVIHYHVLSGCDDWTLLYKTAYGVDKYNNLTDKTKQVNVSKWKRSNLVQNEVKRAQYEHQRRQEEERAKMLNTLRETETPNKGETLANTKNVNFLDRDEFLEFLNGKANEITDDKLRNDYLKMLSDNMRYKDAEREGVEEIQRFYTPITCQDCPIYKRCEGCKVSECGK
jgi:hypothetical protein